MAVTPRTVEKPSIVIEVGAEPRASLLFLSTSETGTLGELNTAILDQLGLPAKLPSAAALARGYHFAQVGDQDICFVVTVGGEPAAVLLRRNLARAVADSQMGAFRSIWLPLMGMGAGRLPGEVSLQATLEVLADHLAPGTASRRITIALPPGLDQNLGMQWFQMAMAELPDGFAEYIFATKGTARVSRAIKADADIALDPIVSGEAASPPARKPAAKKSSPTRPPSPSKPPPEDPLAFERTPALGAALDLAARIFWDPTEKRRATISSTCFFIALAESHQPFVSPALRADLSASCFSAAVSTGIGEQYRQVRDTYLGRDGLLTGQADNPRTQFSRNARDILADARAIAAAADETVVTTDHFITALLSFEHGKAHERLDKAGVHFGTLLEQYRSVRLGQVAMRFDNDLPTGTDQLGYDVYAKAICDFLTHADTPPPLSVSIQAPWGGGKSTLMKLIRDRLDPPEVRDRYKPKIADAWNTSKLLLRSVLELLDKRRRGEAQPHNLRAEPGRLWTVWFNAWKYDTTEQVWAGLVDAIVSQVADRLEPIEREKFLLQLQLARIDDGKIRKKIHEQVLKAWIANVLPWGCAGAAALLALSGASFFDRLSWLIPGGLGMLGAPLALWLSYRASSKRTGAEPAGLNLGDYIRVPDYEKGVGELHQIHSDLRRVLAVVPKVPRPDSPSATADADEEYTPLVIFIDDLDRCSPTKVAAVVEGVSMLLASDTYRCMFVIGMDPQIVAAALEKAHEDMRKQLPPYERTVPIGWRFMDKFVQLPFTVPPAAGERLHRYISLLADPGSAPAMRPTNDGDAPPRVISLTLEAQTAPQAEVEASAVPAPEAARTAGAAQDAEQASAIPDPAARAIKESMALGRLLEHLLPLAAGTPREMKRMVNVARFYLALRAARIEADKTWTPPGFAQYARWIMLTLRWPDMLRWLQWGADEAGWTPDQEREALIFRRLKILEDRAESTATAGEWREAVESALTSCTVQANSNAEKPAWAPWTRDPKLFEFFKAEAAIPAPEERLSDACRQGFW